MDQRRATLAGYGLATAYLLVFSVYVFRTTDVDLSGSAPLVNAIRILVVAAWLAAFALVGHRRRIPLSLPALSIGTLLPFGVILLSGIDLHGPYVFSYCFVSAFAAASVVMGKWWTRGLAWILATLAQVVVDLSIVMSGVYGTFQIM